MSDKINIVSLVANPLKTFKVIHNIRRTISAEEKTTREFEFTVDLYPVYFDLSIGVWNVAISQYIMSNKIKEKLSTMFHVSTNLLTHPVKDPYDIKSQASSKYVPIATIFSTDLKQDVFELERLNPIFFQVENKSRFSFNVRYSEIFKVDKPLDFNVELTFLFQRLL